MADAEARFMAKLAELLPETEGYGTFAARAGTDAHLRSHIGDELERLKEKIADLKASAHDEGEEDMLDELDKIEVRMTRTIDALRGADYSALGFFTREEVSAEDLDRICSYDRELIDDLELLTTDIMAMKYETIGNLTLREAEGTLASIELKVTNRRYIFETGGES